MTQKEICEMSPFVIDDEVLQELATLQACNQLAGIDDELIEEVINSDNKDDTKRLKTMADVS